MVTDNFRSMKDLWNDLWDTYQAAADELKRNGFKERTPAHEIGETTGGKFHLRVPAPVDPHASQEVEEAAPSVSGAKRSPMARIKAAAKKAVVKDGPKPGRETLTKTARVNGQAAEAAMKAAAAAPAKEPAAPAKKAAAPPAKKAAPAPAPAKKKAAAERKPNKSSDPSPDELPKGFDAWLIAQASSKDGVLRTDVTKKAGVERRWMNHLTVIGKAKGLTASMVREGRFTRFFLKA